MDFGIAFSYVFQDEDWLKKIAIGAVLALTGIGLIPVFGWMLEIIRRAKAGDYSLPDWTDFGKLIMDGLKAMLVILIWMIPAGIFAGCISGGSILGADTSGDFLQILGWAMVALGSCLAIPIYLALLVLMPPMISILADTENFGEALNPANSWKLFRKNIGGFLLAILVQAIGFPILTGIGSIACGIGVFPAMAYGYAIIGNLYGQAYAKALEA
jgi:hypothetical protein